MADDTLFIVSDCGEIIKSQNNERFITSNRDSQFAQLVRILNGIFEKKFGINTYNPDPATIRRYTNMAAQILLTDIGEENAEYVKDVVVNDIERASIFLSICHYFNIEQTKLHLIKFTFRGSNDYINEVTVYGNNLVTVNTFNKFGDYAGRVDTNIEPYSKFRSIVTYCLELFENPDEYERIELVKGCDNGFMVDIQNSKKIYSRISFINWNCISAMESIRYAVDQLAWYISFINGDDSNN